MTDHQSDGPADDARQVITFDPGSVPVSDVLITASATINGADPTELEPLGNTVDPDALDALFRPRDGVGAGRGLYVRLRYADHVVHIRGDGTVAFLPDADEG